MNNNIAIETLLKKKSDLETKRDIDFQLANAEINSIESAIAQLSGKKVWEFQPETKYDDENHNYIKGSYEEL